MSSLVSIVSDSLKRLRSPKAYVVALSGGIDSCVLLHALINMDLAAPVRAIHIHHGLHEKADAMVTHCEKLCADVGAPLSIRHIEDSFKPGESVEAWARDRRYQVFADYLKKGEMLLTAHHADDQAETFLLQALRGAGPAGLSAMAEYKTFAKGYLVRPLLQTNRLSIEAYANEKGISWCDDPTNSNLDFDRNYIRNQVMPLLKARYPNAHETLSRAAQHCQKANAHQDSLAASDLTTVRGQTSATISLSRLDDLNRARKENVLRFWLKNIHGVSLPSSVVLARIIDEIMQANIDKNPCVDWVLAHDKSPSSIISARDDFTLLKGERVAVTRYRDTLMCVPYDVFKAQAFATEWRLDGSCYLPQGHLKVEQKRGQGIRVPEDVILSVCTSKPGVRFKPETSKQSRPLKKCWQDWGVPLHVRNRVPLIFLDGVCVEVVGYSRHADYVVDHDEMGYVITWTQ